MAQACLGSRFEDDLKTCHRCAHAARGYCRLHQDLCNLQLGLMHRLMMPAPHLRADLRVIPFLSDGGSAMDARTLCQHHVSSPFGVHHVHRATRLEQCMPWVMWYDEEDGFHHVPHEMPGEASEVSGPEVEEHRFQVAFTSELCNAWGPLNCCSLLYTRRTVHELWALQQPVPLPDATTVPDLLSDADDSDG
eukprot:CAMPEP_0119427010 /NCGR_PEP_ID=MMETSP1335-20130426/37420_1 /TAXON_ID=259385 /ORGANISM="Chrysoculter rhomboideus, Strain RCC1486" /LENGTH=191 /DNA_ID=CAMNT_0007452629 /DNA_START=23 /DNA_END=598 /DNA_ORIENTATION=+